MAKEKETIFLDSAIDNDRSTDCLLEKRLERKSIRVYEKEREKKKRERSRFIISREIHWRRRKKKRKKKKKRRRMKERFKKCGGVL